MNTNDVIVYKQGFSNRIYGVNELYPDAMSILLINFNIPKTKSNKSLNNYMNLFGSTNLNPNFRISCKIIVSRLNYWGYSNLITRLEKDFRVNSTSNLNCKFILSQVPIEVSQAADNNEQMT